MYLRFLVSYVSEIITAIPQDYKNKEIEPNP